MITVRECTKEDLENLCVIENECFVNPWSKDDLLYEIATNPINIIYVAFDEDKLIGFIDYMVTFNSATISQVAVTKKYRKQGIATMLMRKMFESLPSEGDDIVEFVTLEVRQSNEPAINFYLKNGFEKITVKKGYYKDGEDAIYMVKGMR